MENTETPFSAALTYLLSKNKKITQTKLAEEIEMSQSYISALKNGEKDGSEDTRRKISEIFGYHYNDFLKLGEWVIKNNDQQNINIKNQIPKEAQPELYIQKMTEDFVKNLSKFYYPKPLDETSSTENQPISFKNEHHKKHALVINGFTDHKEPLEINEYLVKIQKIKPSRLKKIKDIVKLELKELEDEYVTKKEPDQKNGASGTEGK